MMNKEKDLCMNSTSILILSCHFMTQNQKFRCSPETFRIIVDSLLYVKFTIQSSEFRSII